MRVRCRSTSYAKRVTAGLARDRPGTVVAFNRHNAGHKLPPTKEPIQEARKLAKPVAAPRLLVGIEDRNRR